MISKVTYSDNGTHVLGLANSGQTSDTTTNDKNFCRWDFSCCGDLTSEESAEMIGSLNDSSLIVVMKLFTNA